LRDHLKCFIKTSDSKDDQTFDVDPNAHDAAATKDDLEKFLEKSIEELELSVRSHNCLEAAGIKTIRDLIQKTESEMLK